MFPAIKNGFWHAEIKQAVYVVYNTKCGIISFNGRTQINFISTKTKRQQMIYASKENDTIWNIWNSVNAT